MARTGFNAMLTHCLKLNTILEEHHSGKVLRFGAGKAYPSIKQVNIPVHLGEQPGYILTDVVVYEIPLLLSKDSMKKVDSKLDFVNDMIVMSDQQIQLQHTSNGHYCIPITSKQIPIGNLSSKYNPTVPMEVFISRKLRPGKFQGKASRCYQATLPIWTFS